MDSISDSLDTYLSLVVDKYSNNQSDLFKILNMVLKRKGIVYDSMVSQKRFLKEAPNNVKLNCEKMFELKSKISQNFFNSKNFSSKKIFTDNQQQLIKQLEEIEDKIPIEFRQNDVDEILENNLEKIIEKMNSDEALIEIVQYKPKSYISKKANIPKNYLMFLFLKNSEEKIRLIDLGEVDKVDEIILEFRRAIQEVGNIEDHEILESNLKIKFEESCRQKGSLLRKIILDPINAHIEKCRKLIISTDGNFTQIPFECIPLGNSDYLIDKFLISYVSSTRDLLRHVEPSSNSQKLILANPDYDYHIEPITKDFETFEFSLKSRDFNLEFETLDGTKEEGEKIAEITSGLLWTQEKVLEQNLKNLKSPEILHIATHGFFLKDQHNENQQDSNNYNNKSLNRFENPLLRSGLALTGANNWNQIEHLPIEAEDGIITALEVANLDLFNTKLVVLSACDTALGDIHVGEGVFGLRRSFVIAGTGTLVMSLWKISDNETKDLMIEFYNNMYIKKKSIIESLNITKLKIRKNPKTSHPYFWGAFICQE